LAAPGRRRAGVKTGEGKMAINKIAIIGMLGAGVVLAAPPASARTLKVSVDSV
jgi:hypothetical protein